MFAYKRPLFDLYHFCWLEHLKPVTAGGQQDYIACFKDTSIDVFSIVVVELDLYLALLDEQNLLGIHHISLNLVVYMGRYLIADRAVHVRKLLGELVRGKELYPLLMIGGTDNDRNYCGAGNNFINIFFHVSSYSDRQCFLLLIR